MGSFLLRIFTSLPHAARGARTYFLLLSPRCPHTPHTHKHTASHPHTPGPAWPTVTLPCAARAAQTRPRAPLTQEHRRLHARAARAPAGPGRDDRVNASAKIADENGADTPRGSAELGRCGRQKPRGPPTARRGAPWLRWFVRCTALPLYDAPPADCPPARGAWGSSLAPNMSCHVMSVNKTSILCWLFKDHDVCRSGCLIRLCVAFNVSVCLCSLSGKAVWKEMKHFKRDSLVCHLTFDLIYPQQDVILKKNCCTNALV